MVTQMALLAITFPTGFALIPFLGGVEVFRFHVLVKRPFSRARDPTMRTDRANLVVHLVHVDAQISLGPKQLVALEAGNVFLQRKFIV